MDCGTGSEASSTSINQDINYNEAIAFQGDMGVSINNAKFHIEAMTSDSDENSKDQSLAADFIADPHDPPVAAQSVNRAVFMRNTSDNPSTCHLQNTTINVGGQWKSANRVGNQRHNYAALVRNTGSSTANVKIVGADINICAGATSGGRSEAIGIEGAGNLKVVDGTINIVTGGSVDTKDAEE